MSRTAEACRQVESRALQSFELQVVGGLTIKDPGDTATPFANRREWFHMDGGFLLRISRDEIDFFITAGASIEPLHLDGRITGLLIARGPPNAGLAA